MRIYHSLKATTTLFHTYCAKAILNDKRNATSKFKVTEYRYMIHCYCLTEEAGFYSDVVVFAFRSSDLGSIPSWVSLYDINVEYFLLLMACLCCSLVQENLMMEYKTLKTDVVFFLSFKFKKTDT